MFALAALLAVAAVAADDSPFVAVREHFQKGRIDEALEEYDELERQGADAALIAIGRSQCLEARGDWQQATDVLVQAAKVNDGHASLLARLAQVQLAQGDFAAAGRTVEQALILDADLPLAHLVQADLWAATGRLAEANDGYRWFVDYYNKRQPEDADTLLIVARGALQRARWNSASQIFEFVSNTLCPDALAADRSFWQAHLLGGELFLEKYNRADGMPELRKALALNPRAADVHAALASAALQDHALAEAEQHAGRALAINPRHVAALLVRSDLAWEDGDFRATRDLCEQALAVNPHDERALARLAACDLLEDGPPPRAELEDVLGNLDNVAEVVVATPSRWSARTLDVARRNPHPGVYLATLGEKLETRKKFTLAERFYRQASAAMPQLAFPRAALGMLYMRVGRNEDAAKIMDEAFQADPFHVRVSNMRKVLKLLDGYETLATDHFLIRYDGQADRILARYMGRYLEEQFPELVRKFGFEPPARTQFELFHRAKGLSAHQWFSARMVGLPWVQTIGASTGLMVALASPTASEKPFNWARVVKHEFVHILTLQQTEFNIPHWFTEALAVEAEGYPRPELWNRLLLERVPAGNLMNLDNINLGFIRAKNQADWNMAYCQSRLYSQYLAEKWGADATARLLDAFRRNLSTAQAIEQVCAVDQATFEAGYREYLQTLVAGLRGTLPEPPITLAAAEKAHKADPADARAAARYAAELLRINRRKEARRLAQAALDAHSAEPLAAVVLARLDLRAEDVPAAIDRLTGALDREAPHPEVLELLGGLLLRGGDFAAAEEVYGLGLARDPDSVDWLKGLATALLRQKKVDRLKETLDRLLVVDADNASVPQKLAELALEENDYAAAVRYGRLALHVDVLDLQTHRRLARSHVALGQHEEAASEWSVALELKPDDPELTVEWARAAAAAGRRDESVARLLEFLETHPDFQPAADLLKELDASRAEP